MFWIKGDLYIYAFFLYFAVRMKLKYDELRKFKRLAVDLLNIFFIVKLWLAFLFSLSFSLPVCMYKWCKNGIQFYENVLEAIRDHFIIFQISLNLCFYSEDSE